MVEVRGVPSPHSVKEGLTASEPPTVTGIYGNLACPRRDSKNSMCAVLAAWKSLSSSTSKPTEVSAVCLFSVSFNIRHTFQFFFFA